MVEVSECWGEDGTRRGVLDGMRRSVVELRERVRT